MKRRWCLIAAMALCLIVSMTCCAVEQIDDKLVLATDCADGQLKEMVDNFNKTNCEVAVEIVYYGLDEEKTYDMLLSELKRGEGPDIIALTVLNKTLDAYSVDLSERIDRAEVESEWMLIPAIKAALTEHGEIYQLPYVFVRGVVVEETMVSDDPTIKSNGEGERHFNPLQGMNSLWSLGNAFGEDYIYVDDSEYAEFDYIETEPPLRISRNSKKADLAWEFIKNTLNTETQLKIAGYNGFPVTQEAFLELCDQALAGKVEGGQGVILSQKAVEKLNELIATTTHFEDREC